MGRASRRKRERRKLRELLPAKSALAMGLIRDRTAEKAKVSTHNVVARHNRARLSPEKLREYTAQPQ